MTIWIVPCNLKFYDVIGAFKKFNKIIWKQIVKTIKEDDYVYIYIGKPISALKYKCKVNKVGLSNREIDDQEFIINGEAYVTCGCYMELELLEECSGEYFSLDSLVKHGLVGNIQGPRRALGDLEQYLNSLNVKRLEDEIIEITGIVRLSDDYGKVDDVKPVWIDNLKYLRWVEYDNKAGGFELYEGEMFYYRKDGTKKYFSNKSYTKDNITYYAINPVLIQYEDHEIISLYSPNGALLDCYERNDKYPQFEITDMITDKRSLIMYCIYELESEQTIERLKREKIDNISSRLNEYYGFDDDINDEPDDIDYNDYGLIKYIEIEQKQIIEANASERILINAGPGTGKTWTLIEKIIYMVGHLEIDAETIQVLCFSRAAVDVIRKRIRQEIKDNDGNLEINRIDVRTFDSFATQLLCWVRDSDYELIPKEFKIEKLSYDERIQKFTEVIKAEPELISGCNHLVVDEVQDLVLDRAEMVLTLIKMLPYTCGVTLLGDSCQAIYDYQLDECCTSLNFYKEIKRLGTFKYYSFTKNYRQTSELLTYSDGYRQYLLNENVEDCNEYANYLKNVIPTCNLKLGRVSEKNLNEFVQKYENIRTAILTRNNAQALKISGIFRRFSIDHCMVRKLKDKHLGGWIALVFNKYNEKTIDYKKFSLISVIEKIDGKRELWNFFSEGVPERRLETKEILRKIVDVGTCDFLYLSDKQSPLTISTIHRSKGREYDNVILLDDLLDNSEEIEEHRVKYVAISRARHKLFQSKMRALFFKALDNRRCYGVGVVHNTRKKYLSNFEVGLKGDLITNDFVMEDGLQEWIRENISILPGKEVYLSKSYIQTDGYIYYDVILAYNNKKIGKTSKEFFLELTQAIRSIKGLSNRWEVFDYLYPLEFRGVYITDISSEISMFRGFEKGVQDFGGITTWNSILIEGYAKAVYK